MRIKCLMKCSDVALLFAAKTKRLYSISEKGALVSSDFLRALSHTLKMFAKPSCSAFCLILLHNNTKQVSKLIYKHSVVLFNTD